MSNPGVPYPNPLAYVGPQNNLVPIITLNRQPSATDNNYRVGTIVLISKNPTSGNEGDLWYLGSFTGPREAVWVQFTSGAAGTGIDTVTTDEGAPAVEPDVNGNINILGGTGVEVTGQDPSNDVTIAIDNDVVTTQYDGDSGSATPTVGVLDILGGANITTSAATNVMTVALDAAITVDSMATSDTAAGLTISEETIVADGTDANIDLFITPKGTGGGVISTDLTVGNAAQAVSYTVNGVSQDATVSILAEGTADLSGYQSLRSSTTASAGASTTYLRSKGTVATPLVVADDDVISSILSAGYDGTDYAKSAEIRVEVDATPGAGDMPGRIVMLTSADGGETPIEGLRLDSSQVITLANALPVASGGTGAATLTGVLTGNGTSAVTAAAVTQYGVLVGGASNAVASTAVGTAGQVLTSNGAGVAPTFQANAVSGEVLQQIYYERSTSVNINTSIPSDNTIPQIGEGVEIMSATITPNNASNYILVQYQGWADTAGTMELSTAVFQDATANAKYATILNNNISGTASKQNVTGMFRVSAGTTNPTTFSVRMGRTSGNCYFLATVGGASVFGAAGLGTLTLTEIKA